MKKVSCSYRSTRDFYQIVKIHSDNLKLLRNKKKWKHFPTVSKTILPRY